MRWEPIPIYLFSFSMIMPLSALFPVLPAIRDEINASYSQIAFFVAIVGFVRVVFALPSGLLADRFNRKIILAPGGCLNIGGLIVLSVSHNIYQLIASMFILMFSFSDQRPGSTGEKPAESRANTAAEEKNFNVDIFKLIPVLTIGIFAFFYRGGFQHTLIPFYGKDLFHMSVEALDFYLSLMSITAVICIFIMGMLSDRYGRKTILIPALLFNIIAVLVLMLPAKVNPLMMDVSL